MKQGTWAFQNHRGWLVLIFSLLMGYALAGAQQVLIPRRAFFTGPQRSNFRLSPLADVLYFQVKGENDLHFISVFHPDEVLDLGLTTLPRQWVPMEDGVLLLEKDSLWHLSLRDFAGNSSPFPLPFAPTRLRLLERPVPHGSKVGLWVEVDSLAGGEGVWTLDLKSKAFERIDDLPPIESPILDGNFRPVAGTQPNDSGGNTLWARSPETDEWTAFEVLPFTEDMFTGGFSKVISASADGKDIYFTSNRISDKTELYRYRAESKEATCLARHALMDLLPFGFSLDGDGCVSSVVGLYAKTVRTSLDSTTQREFAYLQSQLNGDISWAGQTPDGRYWLVRVLTGGATQYYQYDRSNRKLRYFFTEHTAIRPFPLATRHANEVVAKDGTRIPIHVYLPHGSDADSNGVPEKPLPTILYVHGGPWVGVFHWNSNFHCRNFQLLANRGYAVINCEFRGSTGLGKEFTRKSYKTWGTDMLQDNVDVAEWAVVRGIARKDRIGIWGWSYGGYAAMSGPAIFPNRYACALAMYGISDLEQFTRDLNDDFWNRSVGDPGNPKEAKLLRKASAIHRIQKIRTPMLLTTGSKDDRIPQPQMGDMAAALAQMGKEVVYFYYPEEGHDYERPESWVSYWAIAEQFLATHLGGRCEPIGDDLKDGDFVVEQGKRYVEGLR